MGGKGSGNWYRWDKKTTIEEVRRIDRANIKQNNRKNTWYIYKGHRIWCSQSPKSPYLL